MLTPTELPAETPHPSRRAPEPLSYTVNDACAATGLGRSSIYELIAAGKLKSVRLAGRRLIPADALRDLLRGVA